MYESVFMVRVWRRRDNQYHIQVGCFRGSKALAQDLACASAAMFESAVILWAISPHAGQVALG